MQDKSLIVLAFDEGGLGNRLTSFSKFLAFAENYKLPFINLSFASYADSFVATKNRSYCHFLPEDTRIDSPPFQTFCNLFKIFVSSRIPTDNRNI